MTTLLLILFLIVALCLPILAIVALCMFAFQQEHPRRDRGDFRGDQATIS